MRVRVLVLAVTKRARSYSYDHECSEGAAFSLSLGMRPSRSSAQCTSTSATVAAPLGKTASSEGRLRAVGPTAMVLLQTRIPAALEVAVQAIRGLAVQLQGLPHNDTNPHHNKPYRQCQRRHRRR